MKKKKFLSPAQYFLAPRLSGRRHVQLRCYTTSFQWWEGERGTQGTVGVGGFLGGVKGLQHKKNTSACISVTYRYRYWILDKDVRHYRMTLTYHWAQHVFLEQGWANLLTGGGRDGFWNLTEGCWSRSRWVESFGDQPQRRKKVPCLWRPAVFQLFEMTEMTLKPLTKLMKCCYFVTSSLSI